MRRMTRCAGYAPQAGAVWLAFSRRAVPKGAFAGVLHITVVKIEDFSDSAGFMDKTDPYVRLRLGEESQRTVCLDNAGGKDVVLLL